MLQCFIVFFNLLHILSLKYTCNNLIMTFKHVFTTSNMMARLAVKWLLQHDSSALDCWRVTSVSCRFPTLYTISHFNMLVICGCSVACFVFMNNFSAVFSRIGFTVCVVWWKQLNIRQHMCTWWGCNRAFTSLHALAH